MSLFHKHTLALSPIDPLGDGLGDDIAAEQREGNTMNLNDIQSSDLESFWGHVVEDIKHDSTWTDFSHDD